MLLPVMSEMEVDVCLSAKIVPPMDHKRQTQGRPQNHQLKGRGLYNSKPFHVCMSDGAAQKKGLATGEGTVCYPLFPARWAHNRLPIPAGDDLATSLTWFPTTG
jgi:hypothetical protein